ncbi:O-antigen ligase domain-containing protein [Paenibacillus chitinolyticus]|uniref:O-antigen ligase domain-containing protein n=1 Tax=Paenibacillus chitinolyticus TaxID=79263 RepID=A0A410WRZ9_9BACL|nr:O-antigen ligase family protein [Paenibacillus chitinolyticus]MCY9592025.1 O-antigen ligase family protein [Paenibacillus chitinolyticus]MCY9598878.1 O-antigen ligase family protein [Paenibacillus chitinolyticus]QAV17080.1 O-antigen ligase domain-containing protein [Paenibacillus chitinolyticus]
MYAYKKPKLDEREQAEKSSIIFWLLIGFVTLFLFWAPFQKALFNGNSLNFERPIYSAVIWASIFLFLTGIYFFYFWKLRERKDLLSLFIFLIPLSYLISLLPAASKYSAVNLLLIQIVLVTLFLIGAYLTKSALGNKIIHIGLLTSGYVIVIFGLMNWLGNGKLAGVIVGWFSTIDATGIYKDAVMTDSNGLRLTSVFQYANTYAGFLIALWGTGLFLVSKNRSWSKVLVHALFLVPVLVSFMLTLSRGAIIFLPIIFFLILIFQKPTRQILLLVHAILSTLASFAVLSKITAIGIDVNKEFSASLSGKGWMLLIGASVIYGLLALLVQRFIAPPLESKLGNFSAKKWALFAIPAGSIVLGILGVLVVMATPLKNLLPENVRIRLETINFTQHSVLERITFYKDASKLFADYPLFGAGGGAWSSLYEQYQNNPYTVRQAHNFFMQYLVEVGAFGILILAVLLVAIFAIYIRNYIRSTEQERDKHFVYFIFVIAILGHSVLDFDMSYVYIGALVFLCLGAMIADVKTKEFTKQVVSIRYVYPSVILVLSIITLFVSARYLSANSSYNKALEVAKTSQNYTEIVTPLNNALSLRANHPEYVLLKVDLLAQLYKQTQDEKYLNEEIALINTARVREPYNKSLLDRELNTLQIKGQQDQVEKLIQNGLNYYPWDISFYERSIQTHVTAGFEGYAAKDKTTADKEWNQAILVYQQVLDRMKELAKLPEGQLQGREFDVTEPMRLYLGQMYFAQGKYADTEALLKPFSAGELKDENGQTGIRYYLAALKKQNKTDQPALDKVKALTPTVEQEVDQIIASTPPL